MLAIGVLLGAPWLVNPVLAGVNVLLTYLFIREVYDRRCARLTVLLLCISPWFIFMGMNFMAHTFTLTCALIASLALVWAKKSNRVRWGFVGGCAVGIVSLIRPLDGLVVAGLLGFWAIGLGGQRLKTYSILTFVLGIIVVGAAVLPYNKHLTGNPMMSPLMAYYNEYYGPNTNALGFGPERGLGWPLDAFPGHSPLEALINTSLNAFSVNIELFGWSIGSLILMAFLGFSSGLKRSDYFMLIVIFTIIGVYSLYWYSGGPDFGARYWFLILVPCVVLTVRGIQLLERIFGSATIHNGDQDTRVMVAVLSLCIFTLLNYFPWRAIDKYHHYLRMRPDIRYLEKKYDFGKSLVLIRGESYPDYASAAVYNPLDLQAETTIYAWDRNPEVRTQVLRAYSDRPVWIVNGPSITRSGYEVIEGPTMARKLMMN